MATGKRLLKPATVLRQWNKLLEENKRPGKNVAREFAARCGMKSMGEVRCAADMDKRKIKYKYEHEQLEYQFEPKNYTPDFTLIDNDDLLIEYKGKMVQETRDKLLAIKRCNPNRKICLVFERANNKLSRRPNSWRYWQWAEKNGFEWSEIYVKEEWLNGKEKNVNNK